MPANRRKGHRRSRRVIHRCAPALAQCAVVRLAVPSRTPSGSGGSGDGGRRDVDAVRTLEGEVRELIRRSGLDPARDEVAVRRLVRDAITDYDERSMLGGLPVLTDLDAASRAVWDTVAGYGPLQQYLDDPTVEEVWVNEPSRV